MRPPIPGAVHTPHRTMATTTPAPDPQTTLFSNLRAAIADRDRQKENDEFIRKEKEREDYEANLRKALIQALVNVPTYLGTIEHADAAKIGELVRRLPITWQPAFYLLGSKKLVREPDEQPEIEIEGHSFSWRYVPDTIGEYTLYVRHVDEGGVWHIGRAGNTVDLISYLKGEPWATFTPAQLNEVPPPPLTPDEQRVLTLGKETAIPADYDAHGGLTIRQEIAARLYSDALMVDGTLWHPTDPGAAASYRQSARCAFAMADAFLSVAAGVPEPVDLGSEPKPRPATEEELNNMPSRVRKEYEAGMKITKLPQDAPVFFLSGARLPPDEDPSVFVELLKPRPKPQIRPATDEEIDFMPEALYAIYKDGHVVYMQPGEGGQPPRFASEDRVFDTEADGWVKLASPDSTAYADYADQP